jgi:catechol 2,3-dioxygenase-like lactoylglutathione lyase family enzyme
MASIADFAIWPVLAASDIGRARKWYEEKLGLSPTKEDEAGGLWFEFTGGTWLLVYPTPNAGTARNTQAHLEVSGIEALMDDLRTRGVEFEEYEFRRLGKDAEWSDGSHGLEDRVVQGQRGQHGRDLREGLNEIGGVTPPRRE